MAVYAIGDLQGCHDELVALLDSIRFDPAADRLWFAGDLVNRGPHSLRTIRAIMTLGDRARSILGNHDLHLLALALCRGAKPRRRDTLDDILAADDRDAIIDWLLQRPLACHDPALDVLMVHAGVMPQWTVTDTLSYANEVSSALGSRDSARAFLESMYGDEPGTWDDELEGMPRLRFITNCLTRMRYCTRGGALDLDEKRAPASADPTLVPWFELAGRATGTTRIVFGHWSTLRLSLARCERLRVYPLDTGAVWGGQLTAMRLEDGVRFSVPARTVAAVN